MTDQELKDLIANLVKSQIKTDEQLKETDKQIRETDKQLKELKDSQAEFYKLLKKSREEFEKQLKKSSEEFDKKLKKDSKEFEKRLKKDSEDFEKRLRKDNEAFNKRIRKLEELVGNIGNNQGDVAEEYFVNSLKDSLKLANIDFDLLLKNVGLSTKNIRDEFDILLVNGNSVALIEVKYKVHPNILEKLPKKIEHLKLMPQYKNYKIYAGIAGFYIPDEVIEEAIKRGYFVLQRKGNVIQTFADNLKVA